MLKKKILFFRDFGICNFVFPGYDIFSFGIPGFVCVCVCVCVHSVC